MDEGHRAFFERLAEHLKRVATELRQLVEIMDAVVGEAHLAGAGNAAAADEAGVGDRFVAADE